MKAVLTAEDDSTVVGIYGVASLFGFMKVSELMEAVATWVECGGASLNKATKFQVTDGKF